MYYTIDPFWLNILSKFPKPPEEFWKFAALDKSDVRFDQSGIITFQFVI